MCRPSGAWRQGQEEQEMENKIKYHQREQEEQEQGEVPLFVDVSEQETILRLTLLTSKFIYSHTKTTLTRSCKLF